MLLHGEAFSTRCDQRCRVGLIGERDIQRPGMFDQFIVLSHLQDWGRGKGAGHGVRMHMHSACLRPCGGKEEIIVAIHMSKLN